MLAKDYGVGKRKIWSIINNYKVEFVSPLPYALSVMMDVTYFGRSWGMLVVIDAINHVPIYAREVLGTERTLDYELAIRHLLGLGFVIRAAVIDGRKGVREMLLGYNIPVQHCQFHQLMTVTQCLTRRPKLVQNIELRSIALGLKLSALAEFTDQLDMWHKKHGDWLRERHIDPESGRRRYAHEKTRRAYFSLRRNLPYLFTFQSKALEEQGIKLPNTSNAIDGIFGAIKARLKLHRGASKALRIKMFCSFLSGRIGVGKH